MVLPARDRPSRIGGAIALVRAECDVLVNNPATATAMPPAAQRPGDWVISAVPAHPALITEADFVTVQTIDALSRPADGTPRHYRLVGACGAPSAAGG